MILAFELTWTGVTHAPVNAAMLRIMAAACPGETVRVHAEPSHLAELRLDARFEPRPVARPAMLDGRTHIVSLARARAEFAAIRAALRDAPAGEPALIVLLSATSTAIWAACLAARLRGGTAVQVLLHGNLADAVGWRTRNPLARRFDLAATLRGRLPAPVRYVVFEPHILPALARIAPRAAAAADVLPHPAPLREEPDGPPPADGVVRIGFAGQGTRAKGFDVFLGLAARHRGRAEFHMLGSVPDDLFAAACAAGLAEPPRSEPLSRAAFAAGMARLDFVLLPFRPGYYDLSASGALLDAVAWGKPVLTTRVALTQAFFAAHCDVGEMDDDADALIEAALAADPARRARQAEALARARAARSVEALAPAYAAAVRRLAPVLTYPVI